MRVTDPNMLRRVSSGSSSLPAKDRAKQALIGIRRYRRCDFEVGSYHFFFGQACTVESTARVYQVAYMPASVQIRTHLEWGTMIGSWCRLLIFDLHRWRGALERGHTEAFGERRL